VSATDRSNGTIVDAAFGPTLTSTTSPTAVEINAMTRIECGIVDGPNAPRTGSTVDITGLCDEESRKKRGTTDNGDITITMYREFDGTDAFWAAFDDATTTTQYLVISRGGFAAATAAATDVVDVYTVQMLSREPSSPTRTESQRFVATLAVVAPVDFDSVAA